MERVEYRIFKFTDPGASGYGLTPLKRVEAYQWFPGKSAPWTIREVYGNYFVLHLYGPLDIFPGDYIVKYRGIDYQGNLVEKHTWMAKSNFERLYEKDKD